jgi:hypothetical protein
MSDFIEQEVSVTSPPASSVDTQTVSDSLPGIDDIMAGRVVLSDPEATKATLAALAPWLPNKDIIFIQDNEEFETNPDKDEDAESNSN